MNKGESDDKCHQEEAGGRQRKAGVQTIETHTNLVKNLDLDFLLCKLRNHCKGLSRGVTGCGSPFKVSVSL